MKPFVARRRFLRLCGLAGLALTGTACPRPPAPVVAHASLEPADWEAFKGTFLRPEGRIVDHHNGSVSHSEGQGFGMVVGGSLRGSRGL